MEPTNEPIHDPDLSDIGELDGKYIRRSCNPNMELKNFRDATGAVKVMIVPLDDIAHGDEMTLPFGQGWEKSDDPLVCSEHLNNIQMCPMEKIRRMAAAQRKRNEKNKIKKNKKK